MAEAVESGHREDIGKYRARAEVARGAAAGGRRCPGYRDYCAVSEKRRERERRRDADASSRRLAEFWSGEDIIFLLSLYCCYYYNYYYYDSMHRTYEMRFKKQRKRTIQGVSKNTEENNLFFNREN